MAIWPLIIGAGWGRIGASAGLTGVIVETLSPLAAQEMPTRDEQIVQGAGDEQAMGVLCEPAIAYLGEAEHPLNDPDRMLLYTAISCTVLLEAK